LEEKALTHPKIAIVGLGVWADDGSGARTRGPVAEYLDAMASLGSVTWFAEFSEGGTTDLNAPVPSSVQVIPLQAGKVLTNTLRIIRHLDRAVVVAAYPTALLIWPLLVFSTVRTAFYLGNDIFTRPPQAGLLGLIRWARRALLSLLCVTRASAVIARGAVLARKLARINHNVLETIPITMQLKTSKHFVSEYQKLGHFVLFVGKLVPGKGVRKLMEVYTSSKDRLLPKLVIVGDGPLRSGVAELALSDARVEYLGYINDPQRLAGLFCAASAIVLPSSEPEGVPRVLTEAQAFGLPIWSTPLPTIVGEFGNSVSYFSSCQPTVEELAEILRSIPYFEYYTHSQMPGARKAAVQHFEALGLTLGARAA
jgi:glycosyltransferase involved in cell wall biosynthesis